MTGRGSATQGTAIVCKTAVVKGIVQGVGFRAHTARQAALIGGLSGWVRNLPDGNVEVLVQGPPDSVRKLLDWCKIGPSAAEVSGVEEDTHPVDLNLGSFSVRY